VKNRARGAERSNASKGARRGRPAPGADVFDRKIRADPHHRVKASVEDSTRRARWLDRIVDPERRGPRGARASVCSRQWAARGSKRDLCRWSRRSGAGVT